MKNYYNDIKEEIIDLNIHKAAVDYTEKRYELTIYYNIGKILLEAGKHYGEGIIKKYSKQLTEEFGKGYSVRSLEYMRKFYNFQKTQPLAANLSWSHYQELLRLKDDNEINYYIKECVDKRLSKRQLREKIKNKEYQNLSESTKNKLITGEKLELPDLVKDPIIINVKGSIPIDLKEKALKELILTDIDNFLKQIGKGTTYFGNEIKLDYKNKNYYVDMLLFNIIYNCYIVVELKVNELRKEDIIQTEMYVDIVDKTLKESFHNKTIGLIVSRKNDRYIIKFSTDNIISTTYTLV